MLAVVPVGAIVHLIKINTLQQEPAGLVSQGKPPESVEASRFIVNRYGLFNMISHYRSQISMVNLFICLCVGSLVALPMGNIIGVTGLEIVRIDIESDNLFEYAEEADEEFDINIYGALSDDLLSSKSRSMNLDFQNYLLTPVSPPPKHA